MKIYLLDEQSKEEIIYRIKNLRPNSSSLWGKMTASEMLFHCRKVNMEVLRAKQTNNTSTFKQITMKMIGLYLMKKFPRGIKTDSKYLPEITDNIAFQKVQSELVDSIAEVAYYKHEIYGEHPFFGPLNTKEWRRFIWKHLDHHLRQFCV